MFSISTPFNVSILRRQFLPIVHKTLLIECTKIVPINPGHGIKEKDPFPISAISFKRKLSVLFPKAKELIVGQ